MSKYMQANFEQCSKFCEIFSPVLFRDYFILTVPNTFSIS